MNKNNKNKTISAIISAYNEGPNIQKFLASLTSQKEEGFVLKEITVISDGSTDDTAEKVRGIKDKRIRLIEFKKRIGKSAHLTNYFRKAESDVVLVFDADIILDSKNTVRNLISPIAKDSKVGLVGGNALPIKGKTFIENAINLTTEVYVKLRKEHHGGNNAFGTSGCILALSRKFYRSVVVPSTMIANDQFLYFSCVTKGFKFRHASSAIAWYRSPITLSDHLKQNKRFIAAHYRLERIFGDVVKREYKISPMLLHRLRLQALFKKPFHALAIYLVNLFCKHQARRQERKLTAKWEMALTTKRDIDFGKVKYE